MRFFSENDVRKKVKGAIAVVSENNHFRLGYPQTEANSFDEDLFIDLMKLNPNNIGVMTRKNDLLVGTRSIELDLIKQLGDFFHDKNADGYVTSGATESNLEALWIAREVMKKKSKKFCLIKTELTHYSVSKAANILGIEDVFDVPLDSDYSISNRALISKISQLSKSGFDGVIVVLTAGYTVTGSSDNIKKICDTLYSIKNMNSFVHVDAAFGGFVLPFSRKKFVFDFSLPKVMSIAVDMHKMGLGPYPSGIFLCRNNLLDNVYRKVGYTSSDDFTVSGSRSGAIASLIWIIFNSVGIKGYFESVNKCLLNKSYFLSKLKRYPLVKYYNPLGVNMVVVTLKKRLKKSVEKKYRLDAIHLPSSGVNKGCEKGFSYRFYFMPHQGKDVINQFFDDAMIF